MIESGCTGGDDGEGEGEEEGASEEAGEEEQEEKPAIEIKTASYDARFPATNQVQPLLASMPASCSEVLLMLA